jgi:hypothetical protein
LWSFTVLPTSADSEVRARSSSRNCGDRLMRAILLCRMGGG